jgi:Type II secretion system (T2SS), protein F
MRPADRALPVGRGSSTRRSPWGERFRRRVLPWERARSGGRSTGRMPFPGPPGSGRGGRRARRERPLDWSAQAGGRGRSAGGRGPSRRPAVAAPAGRAGRQDRPVRPLARLFGWVPGPGRGAAVRRQMEAAVPEVVDVLRATVAAGINPRRALEAAAEGAPPALEAVLGQAIRAAELGSGAGHALATVARAEGLTELALAGEALDLAETTGAPPGPVLAGVATAAADRVRTRQARMAATAQARLSARVVAAMAPVFLAILALTSPTDAAFLIREPLGWAALATATAFELLGICWSDRIVRGSAP